MVVVALPGRPGEPLLALCAFRFATAAGPRWRRRRQWQRSSPGAEEVAVGVGEAPLEGSSISNLALMVPPTVVKVRDAEDPASLACCRGSNSAASIFGSQNLNLQNGK